MTSRLLSQIFNQNTASIYETLREHDAATETDSDIDDLEERAGMRPIARSGRNNDDREDDDDDDEDLDDEGAFQLRHRPPVAESSVLAASERQSRFFPALSGPRGNRFTSGRYRDEDDGTEVPQSLMFERADSPSHPMNRQDFTGGESVLGPEASISGDSGPSTMRNRRLEEQWNAATAQNEFQQRDVRPNTIKPARLGLIDPKERAMWKWANVENLDNFLQDVYLYYVGKGIYNILLTRLLNLLTLVFVVAFSSFLGFCVDYKMIHSKEGDSLAHVMKPHCMREMSKTATFFQWLVSFFCVYKLITYVMDFRRLLDIYNFYTHLLGIPDSDMQTISWQDVVARLMVLRDANPNTSDKLKRRSWTNTSKQRMDAHDIANRLMRRENYLIALFNKGILDLTVPLPFFRTRGGMLTRTLEWNLSQCILDYVFNEQGQFRTLFLKDTHRRTLSEGLRRRFLFAGFMNAFFAPFIATYFLVLFLLRNLHDFIKTPARIGHRQYTPLAEWKFREFNELWHLFQMRINMSYPAAEVYVEQFPKEKTAQVARFVSFVASALLGVLAIGTLVDYELIKGFKIAGELNALSLIAILTTIVAVGRGMLQDEYAVYDPEWSLTNVIQHTHYMPDHWQGKLHSDNVKREFMQLYAMKVSIFMEEVLSVIFTPFILWWSLPKCSDRIIDFFREFTVHVDGVGYVCSFAVFNFQKPGQHKAEDLREEYFATKDNKMLASYLGFMDQYHPTTKNGRRQQPTHPFMVSPVLAGDNTAAANRWAQNRRGPQDQRAPNLVQSIFRESPGRMQSSMMMRSSLLDHHHQPAAFNRSTRTGFQPTSADSLREEDHEDSSETADAPGYRSNLGESFVSTGVKSTVAGLDEDNPVSGGAGVLGLLNQFVAAHGGEGGARPGGAVV
ncbi:APG9-domain-containing protein [Wilcoxina mikolae CBS 423.85]|nr:APG9-domain-containing protein [Wilcoxina mikolae CBS 423.85]